MINSQLDSIKDIYLIAIGGTGMTALAGMLKARGFSVRGSDQNLYPPMSEVLQQMDIPVYEGFDAQHLDPNPDLVVIGNCISRGNPEVEAVLANKMNYLSLPEALKEFFIRSRYSCVVAGTHGKTTTSAMLSWVLENAGRDPGFFIGGIPENFGSGFKLGKGEVFVSEGDEYDSAFFDKSSKFLHYLPDLVILNNIEFDHADIFRNMEDVVISFRRLINLIPGNGYLIACHDDATVVELSQKAFSKVVTFGLAAEADWSAQNLVSNESRTTFDVYYQNNLVEQFEVPLHGAHMVTNCLGVIAAGQALGLTLPELKDGLLSFKNVKRRLQFKGELNNIKIYDDFAHHPSEVKATLNGFRSRFPNRRIWAVLEPRTATSKRKIFEDEFAQAFDAADHVIITPLHLPEKVPAGERLSVEKIIRYLNDQNKPSWTLPANAEMVQFLAEQLQPEDAVLFMSNGDFNHVISKLLNTI